MTPEQETLQRWLLEEWDLDKVEPDAALFSSGLLDSVAMIDLMDFIEASFGVKMKWHEVSLDNLDSITRITDFIARRRGG